MSYKSRIRAIAALAVIGVLGVAHAAGATTSAKSKSFTRSPALTVSVADAVVSGAAGHNFCVANNTATPMNVRLFARVDNASHHVVFFQFRPLAGSKTKLTLTAAGTPGATFCLFVANTSVPINATGWFHFHVSAVSTHVIGRSTTKPHKPIMSAPIRAWKTLTEHLTVA
jgi:hypothetical protein